MLSHCSKGSTSGSSQGTQRIWPYSDMVLPLLPVDIDPNQSFCVEAPWTLLQKVDVQSRTSMRQRTDEPPPRLQLARYINVLDRSQAWSCAPSQWDQTDASRRRPKPTCLICLETSDQTDVWINPTAHCTHEPAICALCFKEYIIHKVEVEGSTTLICPDSGCRRVLKQSDVVEHIEDNTACLDRYRNLITQMDLTKHPNFVWCMNPPCGRGQVHSEGVAVPVVTCEHCHARSCFKHQVPWHSGLTCEQYTVATKHKQENHASEEYIARHAKRCPNPSCRRPILKIDGCDHMTCRLPSGCGHEFCWACLADYGTIRELGNHHHNSNCPYYSGPRRRGQVPNLQLGNRRPPREQRGTRAAATTRARSLAPARPPPTPALNNETVPPLPGPRLLPVIPLPPVPTPHPPSVQPNLNPSPPRRPIPASVSPGTFPVTPGPGPVTPGPGPVLLPAPPLMTRSSGRGIRRPLSSAREEISSLGKAQDILSIVSSVTWWCLVYLLLVLVGLILHTGKAKPLA